MVSCAVGLKERIDELKRRRRNVSPDELHGLLSEAGFARRQGKGDHWIYSHPLRTENLSIDPHKPLLPVYVSKAIRAIEEVLDDDDPS